ncbi:MAG: 30S ribosomal protein S2 [DPANN group archaeon]|nr:30S ribosomal protein S2 [DPANN group archaeon]
MDEKTTEEKTETTKTEVKKTETKKNKKTETSDAKKKEPEETTEDAPETEEAKPKRHIETREREASQSTGTKLVPLEKYLEAGAHIGSRFRSGHMKRFIYKYRPDGLCILDTNQLDERINVAAQFLSKFEPQEILIVAGRIYAQKPAKMLAETIGAKYIIKRFTPGTLTNPGNENFIEPKVLLVADAPIDRQAIKEATHARVPVIALCDTSNLLTNIDLAMPSNNKGKKAIALIYWLLAREYLKNRGLIKSDADFTTTPDDFESKTEMKEKKEPAGGRFASFRGRGRPGPSRGPQRSGPRQAY